jgi:hypothetical protein
LDLVARREPERRVVPQAGESFGHPGRPQDLGTEPGELPVDTLDLLEADLVDLLRGEGERRVRPDEMGVRSITAGDVGEPGPVIGAGIRAQLVDEDGSLALERRPDAVPDRGQESVGEIRPHVRRPIRVVGRGQRRQRPVLVVDREEVVELVHDAVDEGSRRDQTLGGRRSQAVDVTVDPGTHRAPSLQRGLSVVGVVQWLVAGDVQEEDLGPIERVDGPPVQARLDEPETMLEIVDERGARHPVGVTQGLRGECPDLVQEATVLPSESLRGTVVVR